LKSKKSQTRNFNGHILLRGGKNPVWATEIRRGDYIGGQAEGSIHEVEVVLEKGNRRRTVKLAEKEFVDERGVWHRGDKPNFANPTEQFETMQTLLKLNRERKLGLHIIPTIRLMGEGGYAKPRLIITRLKGEVDHKSLNKAEYKAVDDQKRREKQILKQHGFVIHSDVWIHVRDPKTGKVTAWIVDFGNLRKTK
tara:strand:+ start:2946 stop:3530 length:585 start_codon:yes stop_codon:yes gene_type:complete